MKKTLHIAESVSNHELGVMVSDEIKNGATHVDVFFHEDDHDEGHQYDLHDAVFYSKHFTHTVAYYTAGALVRFYQVNDTAKILLENAKLN